MNSYLKNYKVRLKTLAPVFVGSGKEINKREYVLDGRFVYVMDEKKLIDTVVKKGLINDYLKSIGVSSFNLKAWLNKNGIRDYKSLSAYTLSGVENIDTKHSLKGIKTCMKTAYNEPYIPGSSLKGVLRTVILWNEVYDNSDTLKNVRRDLNSNLSIEKPKILKKEMGRSADRVEKRFLNKKVDDEDYSIMRGLVIGDSKPLSLDDIVLCEKLDVNLNGKEKRPNILRECIRPETEIEFDLTIDDSIFHYTADNLDDMVKNYAADYYDIVTSMFPHGEEEENTIYLGGGAGYFSKTFTYSLFETDEAVAFVKKYLAKTTPRVHNHFKDRGISPHMQKCTRCGGRIYEMGKCQIRIEEV